MTLWTAAHAAAATGGRVASDWTANGVSIDTRELAPGDLFVALKDIRDGHDFVAQALAFGASAALVSRVPDVVAEDKLLIVEDVLQALEAMGRAARARTKGKVVGITGSVGKTSTKEMLRTVLSRQGKTHAAERSFNNHWGVPLTLARMPADTDFAVIEIGMNAPGEIAPLAQMADLDVALITIVAPAHLAAFDSVDAIAEEKADILTGLRPGGTAILNADTESAAVLMARAKALNLNVQTFGSTAKDYHLASAQTHMDTTVVQATAHGAPLLFKLATPGAHFAMNALGALAVTEALGGDLGRATVDLAQWLPFEGRGVREVVYLDEVDDRLKLELIDDSFNANPASTGAALDMLAATQPNDGLGRVSKGRRIAILGDMLELGPTEVERHAALAAHPAMEALDIVHCVGPLSRALWEALPEDKRGHWSESSAEFTQGLHARIDAGDVALVKGSKGIKLGVVVDALKKLGHSAPKEKD